MQVPYFGAYTSETVGRLLGQYKSRIALLAVQHDFRLHLVYIGFRKTYILYNLQKERLKKWQHITTLARTEGLEAHARAIEVRFEK